HQRALFARLDWLAQHGRELGACRRLGDPTIPPGTPPGTPCIPRAGLYDEINYQFYSGNSQNRGRGHREGEQARGMPRPRPSRVVIGLLACGPFRKAGVEMAKRVLNRRQLRAESDEAARVEATPAAAPAPAGAPAPAKAARKPRKAR